MSDKYFTVIKDGQLAIATVEQTGTIIPEPDKDPTKYTTCLVQTDDGAQLCQKVLPLNGGGGGYVLPPATASTLGGVKVGANLTVEADGTLNATGGGGGADKANTNLDNLTDSAQIPVANLLDDLYNTVGYNIVGSDVTVTDGVASGFSSTSYLQGIKAPNTANKVDITIKFKITGATDGCLLFFRNLYFFAYPNGNILSAQYASDSSWKNLLIESGQTFTNTDVWVHFVDTGTSQEMEYSLDGVNYVGKVTSAYTDDLTEDYALEIGSRWQGSNPFQGEIDLNETVILLDDKPWFFGKAEQVNPAYLAMPSHVYEDLTIPSVDGTDITVPADGYLCFRGVTAGESPVLGLSNNTTGLIITSNATFMAALDFGITLPVKKGDSVKVGFYHVNFNDATNPGFLRFIYANGSKNEHQGA